MRRLLSPEVQFANSTVADELNGDTMVASPTKIKELKKLKRASNKFEFGVPVQAMIRSRKTERVPLELALATVNDASLLMGSAS